MAVEVEQAETFRAQRDRLDRIANGGGGIMSTQDVAALRAMLLKLDHVEAAAAVVLEENDKLNTALQREGSR